MNTRCDQAARSVAEHTSAGTLPLAALLALTMTGFICIMTETLPAGVLPDMAQSLGVAPALAGQTITAYALGSMLAAIPLTIATSQWRRRRVLLAAIVGFLVFNTVTALSGSYAVILVARFLAGVATGLAWSLLAGYARRLVRPNLHGRAIAVAMLGTPVALSLGVPAGAWLGGMVGWRLTFVAMSVMTLVLIGWVVAKLPDFPGQPRGEGLHLVRVARLPGMASIMTVIVTWMLAHNALYTYIAPVVAPAGLTASVGRVLMTFGCAALVGIWIIGRVVDHHLRSAVVISLAGFLAAGVTLLVWPTVPGAIYFGIAVWGLTFGGAATLLITAATDVAGQAADVAVALTVVVWNAAIAGGGLIGGMVLSAYGARAIPAVVAALAVISLVIVGLARRHGFTPGPRLRT